MQRAVLAGQPEGGALFAAGATFGGAGRINFALLNLRDERERLSHEKIELVEEKAGLVEERSCLEAELKILKNCGFWPRLFGG